MAKKSLILSVLACFVAFGAVALCASTTLSTTELSKDCGCGKSKGKGGSTFAGCPCKDRNKDKDKDKDKQFLIACKDCGLACDCDLEELLESSHV